MQHLSGGVEDIISLVGGAGDLAASANTILQKVRPHIGIVRAIVEDKGFVPLMTRVKTIVAIEDAKVRARQGLPPAPPRKPEEVPASMKGGIGLSRYVPYVDAYIFLLRNPVAGYGAIAGFLGLFVGAGYLLGKRAAK